ncbi:hypothetical protein MKX54_07740 [Alkalihalobacillus sp. FSL R5-0424]
MIQLQNHSPFVILYGQAEGFPVADYLLYSFTRIINRMSLSLF